MTDPAMIELCKSAARHVAADDFNRVTVFFGGRKVELCDMSVTADGVAICGVQLTRLDYALYIRIGAIDAIELWHDT